MTCTQIWKRSPGGWLRRLEPFRASFLLYLSHQTTQEEIWVQALPFPVVGIMVWENPGPLFRFRIKVLPGSPSSGILRFPQSQPHWPIPAPLLKIPLLQKSPQFVHFDSQAPSQIQCLYLMDSKSSPCFTSLAYSWSLIGVCFAFSLFLFPNQIPLWTDFVLSSTHSHSQIPKPSKLPEVRYLNSKGK